ncbi:MAG: (Fe-S)-binding protein [Promethearchaeota archaeon]
MGLEEVKEWLHYCGRCNSCKYIYRDYRDSCPAFVKFLFEPYTSSGKIWMALDLYQGKYSWSPSIVDKIYKCTLCGNCTIQCQQEAGKHALDIFEALREECVERGIGPLEAHRKFLKNVNKENNPYGEPKEERFKDIPQKYFRDNAEVIYFVGCTSAYREKQLFNSVIPILEQLNIDFTLIKEEVCCGSPLITTGQKKEAKKLAEINVSNINKMEGKILIASCAGCLRTLKSQYKKKYDLVINKEILHISEFLAKKLSQLKKLYNTKKRDLEIATYHDPCHIGRHLGIYDEPRKVLKSIPGIKFVEIERNRDNAWCCGAGAGVKSGLKDWAVEIAEARVKEAEETEAKYLVSTCPFCERNLRDATIKLNSNIEVIDLTQLILKKLK